jgi:hypothetical protein
MLEKHPAVKIDWKVPEPIKAAGETLRGVLIVTVKDVSSELKTAASEAAAGVMNKTSPHGGTKMIKRKEKSRVTPQEQSIDGSLLSPDRAESSYGKRSNNKQDSRTARVDHIEIDLTGVEGKGTISRFEKNRAKRR